MTTTRELDRPSLFARIAEVINRSADACGAVGDVAGALRRLAQAIEMPSAPKRSPGVRRAPSPPKPSIEFSELDTQRAMNALHQVGVPVDRGSR